MRTVTFSAPIWKTALDEENAWLALEIRDADTLQVEFAVLDLKNAKLISSGIRLPERWWLSLVSADNGMLHINQISSKIGGSSEIKKWIFDVKSGQTLESKLAPYYKESAFSESRENIQFTHSSTNLDLPFHYAPDSGHYKTLQLFLNQKLGISVTGPIEYSEVKDRLLFSYYTQEEASFSNYFVNFGKDGAHSEVLCLESGLSGFGKDTFMVWQHELVLCIQNRNTLMIIDL